MLFFFLPWMCCLFLVLLSHSWFADRFCKSSCLDWCIESGSGSVCLYPCENQFESPLQGGHFFEARSFAEMRHYGTNDVNKTDVCLSECGDTTQPETVSNALEMVVWHIKLHSVSAPTQSRHEALVLSSSCSLPPPDKTQIAEALQGLGCVLLCWHKQYQCHSLMSKCCYNRW